MAPINSPTVFQQETQPTDATPRLSCLICVYSNEPEGHAFILTSGIVCDTEVERAQNNCRACGGASTCHDTLQAGECHQECSFAHEELQLLQTFMEGDTEGLLELYEKINQSSENGVRVELNRERRSLQVMDCKDELA